ncbi:MAG: hypothetical protein JW940_07330 [Polyangiaceae bacterium]|nr:hypothetical protein [Polyangiaceae bacterium]
MKSKLGVLATFPAALATIICAAQPSSAIEPADNAAPWNSKGYPYFNTASYYTCPGNGCATAQDTIASSTDVDYHVVSCGRGRHMVNLGIYLTHSNGDLDIDVFSVHGGYIASSTDVTNHESVNIRGVVDTSAAVVRVYGYAGATNSYILDVFCL